MFFETYTRRLSKRKVGSPVEHWFASGWSRQVQDSTGLSPSPAAPLKSARFALSDSVKRSVMIPSAIASAAAGRASARALSAINLNAAGSVSNVCTSFSSSSPVHNTSSNTTPAPVSSKAAAFWAWWSSVACGYGTSIHGFPSAASSAVVDAPERATTRSAALQAPAISSK